MRIDEIPMEIQNLKKLEILNLRDCSLNEIPIGICYLKNLKKLILNDNQITKIPPEIGQLTNLKELKLDGNRIQEIPDEIGCLKSLEILSLYTQWSAGNSLTRLPPQIGELTNLIELSLSKNDISELPIEIFKLKKLQKLHLYDNKLTELPPQIGHLKNLKVLDLGGTYNGSNDISVIPKEIKNLKKLEKFILSSNGIVEIIPEFGELSSLVHLDLKSNYALSHKLPNVLTKLSKLSKLILISCHSHDDKWTDEEQKKITTLLPNTEIIFEENEE
jgi:Leucine-rich repeat (LRR) protein